MPYALDLGCGGVGARPARPTIGVVPACPPGPGPGQLAARVPDDAGDDAQAAHQRPRRTGPCSMWSSRNAIRRRAFAATRRCSRRGRLLRTKDDDGSRPRALDRLDRRDDAERAVEAAGRAGRVWEVRA